MTASGGLPTILAGGEHASLPVPGQAAASIRAACVALVDELYHGPALPSVYLLVDGRLRCQAARGYFQVVDGFLPDTGVIGRVVRTGIPVVLEDVAREPAFIAAIPGLVAEVCVPIRVHGVVVGAINVESTAVLPRDIVGELEPHAARLAAAIEAGGGMPPVPLGQRLARIVVGLTALTERPDIQAQAVDAAIDVAGMDSAALSEIGLDRRWSVRQAAGPLAPALRSWTHSQHETIARWGGPGTSSHFPGGTDVPDSYRFLLRAGVRAIAVQPLVVRGRVTGLLTTAASRAVAHDPDTGAAMELLAAQVAAALAMAAELAVLGERAVQDPLTGLRHAGAFAEDLERAAGTTRRDADRGRACVLIDIDHFKKVNDTSGHQAGDQLLRAVADALGSELRGDDRLYRIGGDEFAALVDTTDQAEAALVAARMVCAARRTGATVSAGVAMLVTGDASLTRSRADRALYRAKAAGRDRHEGPAGA